MENVIITGADGFVGSHTVHKFLEEGKRVLALDVMLEPKRLKVQDNLQYIQCDISDVDEMLKKIERDKYDTFIHFAWGGSAGPGRTDYNLQMQNVQNTINCVRAAKEVGCTRFVGAGSIMEYEMEDSTHTQGNKPSPSYIYSLGKFVAHSMSKIVAAEIGIDLLWPMITNAYGVGEYSPRFVNSTLRKMINKEPLEFTAGTQTYDFVYVSDVAKAFFLVAEKGKPFCEYMIGSGKARPLKEFILEMVQSCSPDQTAHFGNIPYAGTILPIKTYSIKALEEDCGFKPDWSFAEGTKKTMEWLRTI